MPDYVAARPKAPMAIQDTRWTDLALLTVSSVGDLLGCSKKYDVLRVKKQWPTGRKVPVTVPRGSAWHETLRALHAARWGDELPMNDLETYAQTAVQAARYDRDVNRLVEVQKVGAMAQLFCDNQDASDIEAIIALETQVEFDYSFQGTRLARIAATIDRVLIRPDQPNVLILQDFKSTLQSVHLAECFLLIWAAARKWPGFEYVLELIWVDQGDGTVSVDRISADMVRPQHKLITTALLQRLDTEPVAESGPACVWCPLRDACQGLPALDMIEDEVPF